MSRTLKVKRLVPQAYALCCNSLQSLRLLLFKRALKSMLLLVYLSDANLLRVVRWVKRLSITRTYGAQMDAFETLLMQNHPFVQLGRNILKKPEKCRAKLVDNLLINALFVGNVKRARFSQRNKLPAPWFFVVSPTN